MKPLNTQKVSSEDLVAYNKVVQLNNKMTDTYFFSISISVFTYVFQKLVSSVRDKAMKR
ncbi:hypothetical protein [Cellulosilyticum sp. I15G10I2]|uniref:hypothetical protein n=1 Tax=Cellulosilyticum sp. I15G10I2 TaxID=1892843 RepID=UPI0014960724|nr:hypothetical protein [Cellulosilyticum sp. I15G10I2]